MVEGCLRGGCVSVCECEACVCLSVYVCVSGVENTHTHILMLINWNKMCLELKMGRTNGMLSHSGVGGLLSGTTSASKTIITLETWSVCVLCFCQSFSCSSNSSFQSWARCCPFRQHVVWQKPFCATFSGSNHSRSRLFLTYRCTYCSENGTSVAPTHSTVTPRLHWQVIIFQKMQELSDCASIHTFPLKFNQQLINRLGHNPSPEF